MVSKIMEKLKDDEKKLSGAIASASEANSTQNLKEAYHQSTLLMGTVVQLQRAIREEIEKE